MLKDDDQENVYFITLQTSKFYGVGDLFRLIAKTVFPCDHRPLIERKYFDSRWGGDVESMVEERIAVAPKSDSTCCEDCKKRRQKYRFYLGGRLREAVLDKKIKIWRTFPVLLVFPPNSSDQSYDNYYRWAILGDISRADLILFCKEYKISVEFQSDADNLSKKQIVKKPCVIHGNSERNEKRRKNVIDKAMECRESFPDECHTGSQWAETLDQKSALYWPGKDAPPLSRSVIEKMLREVLKNEKLRAQQV